MFIVLPNIFLGILLLISEGEGEKVCEGTKLDYLPMGCDTIIGRPLTIEFLDADSLPIVFQKLSTIRVIRSGLVLRHNDISAIRFPNLTTLSIYEDKGPVLSLERNHRLARLEFPELRRVYGSLPLVDFWQDHFPLMMRKNNRALGDFLEFISHATHLQETCSDDLFDLHVMNEDWPINDHWYYWAAGTFGLAALVFSGDIMISSYFQYQWDVAVDRMELEKADDKFQRALMREERDAHWKVEVEKIDAEEEAWMENLRKQGIDPNYDPVIAADKAKEKREKLQRLIYNKKLMLENEERRKVLEKEEAAKRRERKAKKKAKREEEERERRERKGKNQRKEDQKREKEEAAEPPSGVKPILGKSGKKSEKKSKKKVTFEE